MIPAFAAQVIIGCLWAAIYGTEARVFEWPWFLAWAAGLSLTGFAVCHRGARGQALGRRLVLGMAGPAAYVMTAVGAFGAGVTSLSLVGLLVTSSAMMLPSWLGCVMARWKEAGQ